MNIQYKNGLLYTSVKICYQGQISGLLGLDILIAMGALIDLKEFKIL